MKKLALITLVLAVFCSALSFAGYVGFQAVEFTIITALLVLVFREIRKAEAADTGRTHPRPGS